jgi:hypothetical protein
MTKVSLKQNGYSGPVFGCESLHPQAQSRISAQRSSNYDGCTKQCLPASSKETDFGETLSSVGAQPAPQHAAESPRVAGQYKTILLQCPPRPTPATDTSYRVLQGAPGIIRMRMHTGSPSSISAISGNSASTGRMRGTYSSPRERSEHASVTPQSKDVEEEPKFYTPKSQVILEDEPKKLIDHDCPKALEAPDGLSAAFAQEYRTPPRIVRNASAPAEVFIDLFKTPEFAKPQYTHIVLDDVSIMSDSSKPSHRPQIGSPTTICLPEIAFKARSASNVDESWVDTSLNSSGPQKDRSCAMEDEGPLVLVTESVFAEEAPVVLVGCPIHSTYNNPLPDSAPAATLLNCNDMENWAWCNRERHRPTVAEIKSPLAKKELRSKSLFFDDDFLLEQHSPTHVRHDDNDNDSDSMPFSVPCPMLGDCQGCSETCNARPDTDYSSYQVTASHPSLLVVSQLQGTSCTDCKEDESFGFETEAIFARCA